MILRKWTAAAAALIALVLMDLPAEVKSKHVRSHQILLPSYLPPCEIGELEDYCDPGRCDCCVPHAECIDHTCECALDYENVHGICKPACEIGELDGYCDTGRCDCCVPHAECIHHTCVCTPEYENVNGICKPVLAPTPPMPVNTTTGTTTTPTTTPTTTTPTTTPTTTTATTTPPCAAGFGSYTEQDIYLKIIRTLLNFTEAEAACEAEFPGRTELVSISSAPVTQAIIEALAGTDAETKLLWTGLERTGPWAWIWPDGVTFSVVPGGQTAIGGEYTNWQSSGSADGATNEACMRIRSNAARTWEDQRCDSTYWPICQCYIR